MARTTMQLGFISAERVKFDNVDLVKMYFGDEPDGQKDLGLSLIAMQVHEDVRDEVWASCKGLDPLEAVSVTVEIDRGSKNAGKLIVLQVEAAKPKAPVHASSPAAKPAEQVKP